jgi:phosphinothricin acetyltransferase
LRPQWRRGGARGQADPVQADQQPDAPRGLDLTVVALAPQHWPQVRAVHAEGIATGEATFEPEPPTWERFDAGKLPGHRLVALEPGGRVLGWAAVSAVSSRPVYAGVVEHSVYVGAAARGRGVGRALLEALIASTERAGIWTLQSGVFPENTASLALHGATGFRVVGVRERLGRMQGGPLAGTWRDVVLLERRSSLIG